MELKIAEMERVITNLKNTPHTASEMGYLKPREYSGQKKTDRTKLTGDYGSFDLQNLSAKKKEKREAKEREEAEIASRKEARSTKKREAEEARASARSSFLECQVECACGIPKCKWEGWRLCPTCDDPPKKKCAVGRPAGKQGTGQRRARPAQGDFWCCFARPNNFFPALNGPFHPCANLRNVNFDPLAVPG